MAFYSSYWDETGDTKTKPDWSNAFKTNFKSGFDPGTDVSKYWDPKGDSTNIPWSDAVKWDGKTFLDSYRQKLQESTKQEEDKSRAFAEAPQRSSVGGGMVASGQGWNSQQMLPNLSSLQYNGPTIQMAGVQGGPGFFDTTAGKLVTGLGQMALSAALPGIGSALGLGAKAGMSAAGAAAGSTAFGAGGAAFNPAAFSMGSLI